LSPSGSPRTMLIPLLPSLVSPSLPSPNVTLASPLPS
jgi:hypothetical protein